MTLLSRCAALLPRGTVWARSDPIAPATGLMPVEADSIAHAVPARRAEFAAGRRAAHETLAALGFADSAVPMNLDRSPRWPDGITGSIAHSPTLCLAVAARIGDIAALGVDIEPDEDLPCDLVDEIAFGPERDWLREQLRPARAARHLFAIKESVYKCQYPLTGRMLEFRDVMVTCDPARGVFDARITGPARGSVSGRTLLMARSAIAAASCGGKQVIAVE